MAILEGGIFSNPRGKTGGIVFGAARTRTGKKVTSRLLVPPSNPNTAAQQVQRLKFANALAIVRLIGSAIYQSDWNRAIGQLPGFQSMTSVYLNSMDSVATLGVIPSINLGSLHQPATFVADSGAGSGLLNIAWSKELGINGTDADVLVILAVHQEKMDTPLERPITVDVSKVRNDADFDLDVGFSGEAFTVLIYFRGAGAAEGLLSPTSLSVGTTG